MSSFPWDTLKAETLRSMCKDLGAGPVVKRNKENMVSFLEDIEKRGPVIQEGKATLTSTSKTATTSAASTSDSSNGLTIVDEPITKVPSDDEQKESDDRVMAVSDVPTESEPNDTTMSDAFIESDPACQCQDGWLSPRLKFVLSVTAAVATDLIIDTGEFAGEYGHVGCTYLTEYIPGHLIPRGKKAVVQWIEAFAAIFGVIRDMFEAGEIPTTEALEHKLSQLPKSKQKLIKAYSKQGAEVDNVLEALVLGAKYEWEENDFEDTHGDLEWNTLPVCAEHDLNWTLAEDMLAG